MNGFGVKLAKNSRRTSSELLRRVHKTKHTNVDASRKRTSKFNLVNLYFDLDRCIDGYVKKKRKSFRVYYFRASKNECKLNFTLLNFTLLYLTL